MKFANAIRLDRKSGVRWGRTWAPVRILLAAAREDLHQLLRWNHFELGIGTIARRLV